MGGSEAVPARAGSRRRGDSPAVSTAARRRSRAKGPLAVRMRARGRRRALAADAGRARAVRRMVARRSRVRAPRRDARGAAGGAAPLRSAISAGCWRRSGRRRDPLERFQDARARRRVAAPARAGRLAHPRVRRDAAPFSATLLRRYAPPRRRRSSPTRAVSRATSRAPALARAAQSQTIYNGVDLSSRTRRRATRPISTRSPACRRRRPARSRSAWSRRSARWKGHDVVPARDRAARSLAPRPRLHHRRTLSTTRPAASISLAELRAMAAAARRRGSRRLHRLHRSQPAAALRALDVVVHASTEPEPFGLVIAEAHGVRPGRSIVSAAGGAAELVEPDVDALTHAPGDDGGSGRCDRAAGGRSRAARAAGRRGAAVGAAPFRCGRRSRRAFVDVYERAVARPGGDGMNDARRMTRTAQPTQRDLPGASPSASSSARPRCRRCCILPGTQAIRLPIRIGRVRDQPARAFAWWNIESTDVSVRHRRRAQSWIAAVMALLALMLFHPHDAVADGRPGAHGRLLRRDGAALLGAGVRAHARAAGAHPLDPADLLRRATRSSACCRSTTRALAAGGVLARHLDPASLALGPVTFIGAERPTASSGRRACSIRPERSPGPAMSRRCSGWSSRSAPVCRRGSGCWRSRFAVAGLAAIYLSQVRISLVVDASLMMGVYALVAASGRAASRGATQFGDPGGVDRRRRIPARRGARRARDSRSGHDAVRRRSARRSTRAPAARSSQLTFNELLFEYPLGAGLGRWGMAAGYFGSSRELATPVWAEIQFTGWMIDGGVLMIALYVRRAGGHRD